MTRRNFSSVMTLFVVFMVSLLAGCRTAADPGPSIGFTPAPQADDDSADAPAADQPATDEIAVTVNGEPISMDAYQRELARFEAGQVALGFEISDEAGYRQQVLDLLVEQELIRQRAASQNIVIGDAAVDAVVEDMIAETGEDYFNSWLQSNYYSMAEFREVIRLDLLTNELLTPVLNAVPDTAEHVHARHILVTSETEAQTVLNRLEAGEDFATLAAEFSTDVSTRDQGGDLGWFPRGGLLVAEVEEAAFSLEPGETSGVISSAWGYHIVQTIEFDPNRAVDEETRQRLMENAIEAWRMDLRSGATIEQYVSPTS